MPHLTPPNHFLIGPPGSGKTTLAHALQQLIPQAIIISTDAIRAQLYGDPSIQGEWTEIQTEVIRQIQAATQAQTPIIYDATNVKRSWRMELLHKLNQPHLNWIAWVLTTPLATCQHWNRQRENPVPKTIITDSHTELNRLHVLIAEGFTSILTLDPSNPKYTPFTLNQQLTKTTRSSQNKRNRDAYIHLHGYSHLLDFDRLLHLIHLLSQTPGIGQLHQHDPQYLQTLLKTTQLPLFNDSIAEIAAVMAAQYGHIYANPQALTADLHWLEHQGFLGTATEPPNAPLDLPAWTNLDPPLAHPYSDSLTCQRLLGIIRFIIQQPLTQINPTPTHHKPGSQLMTLTAQLKQHHIHTSKDTLRKDIEMILKPYQLLPAQPLRQGYFLGTGILNRQQMHQLYELVHKQVNELNDVLAIDLLHTLETRMRRAQYPLDDHYPTRTIHGGSIVDPTLMSEQVLGSPTHANHLESAILAGQQLRIVRCPGAGTFDPTSSEEEIWPLQIVFANIAWYLAYQVATGPKQGLFSFERLDRLYSNPIAAYRSLKHQRQALKKLETLCKYSYGIYLGTCPQQQQTFLAATHQRRLAQMETLDLRFTDDLFRFVSEATQRFPRQQTKMSPPPERSILYNEKLKSIYRAKPDLSHPNYVNVLQVKLPNWSFADVNLKAWLLGLGSEVQVIGPTQLRGWVSEKLATALDLYQHHTSPPTLARVTRTVGIVEQ